MHALFKVQGNETGGFGPSSDAIIFSTDNPIAVGDSKTTYYDRDQAHNPRVVLTREAIYFLSKQSPDHNLYMDLIDIESYKIGSQKNALVIEIVPTSSDKNRALNNNLVTNTDDQLIKITFASASKKHQADLRSTKEDHDLLLATLTGLLEARMMTFSVRNSAPAKVAEQKEQNNIEVSNTVAPKIICDDQEASSVFQTAALPADPINDVRSVAIFAPREPSVFKHEGQSADSKQSAPPIMAQSGQGVSNTPTHNCEPDLDTIMSTLLQEDYLKEFSRPLTFDRIRKPNNLLTSINKLMLLFLKASNGNDCKNASVVSSILEKKLDDLESAGTTSLQTLTPSAEEFFTKDDYENSLEELLGVPHVTNTALIELKGKSPAYIMSTYINSYTSSYSSMTPINIPDMPFQMFTAGLQNVNVAPSLSKYSLSAEAIAKNLPALLLNYTLMSPFHSEAKFKLIPVDEVYSLLNRARPVYPVSIETFHKAIRIADDECKTRINEKSPYHSFPLFLPWKINNTWYFVQKAVRLTNVIHFIVVNVLYNAWTKIRAENPQPNKPHTYVTADELTSKFGLSPGASSDLLDFMVRQRLLVVDVCTSKRYYLNLITKHYRCLQDSASKISKITA